MGNLIIKSLLLGAGLAMDACAVSMVDGFSEPKMKLKKTILIAVMFGLFQGLMPLIGYFIGFSVIIYIERWIPWIALVLLCFIGGKMLFEALKISDNELEEKIENLTFKTILIQAFATSVDALSVGLTFSDYTIINAIIFASIITIVTLIFSFVAVFLGKKFGTKLGKKAEIVGGIILVCIGIEIFITGLFF